MTTTERYAHRLQDPAKARRYAERFERGSRRHIHLRELAAVEKIFAGLAGTSVVDVPSGAGRFMRTLAKSNRWVVEIDVAWEILEFVRERAAAERIPVLCLQGNASKLPLQDNSVDGIFCNRLLHHITSEGERAVILRELFRVCRKHAVVSFFDYLAFGQLRLWLKRLKGRTVDYVGQPTLSGFTAETVACGFRVAAVVPTGPPWVAQKYLVLAKS
jgi:ubiquinone/menaquinone biosynthesis C-methylase UbiE